MSPTTGTTCLIGKYFWNLFSNPTPLPPTNSGVQKHPRWVKLTLLHPYIYIISCQILVFESPVWSGLLAHSALDRNCNQSSQFEKLQKTGLNHNRLVVCGFLQLQDRSRPVMVLTSYQPVLTGFLG